MVRSGWAICLTPIAFICAVKRMKFRSCMSTRSGTAKMISPTLAEPDLLLASRMVEARLRMADLLALHLVDVRSEEHTSELQSLMRISYAVFCLKKKKKNTHQYTNLLYNKPQTHS